jgi:hypothetical protein
MSDPTEPCDYGDHLWVRSNHRLGHAASCVECGDEVLATDEEWGALPWATAESTTRLVHAAWHESIEEAS